MDLRSRGESLLHSIRRSVVGRDRAIETPFGIRRITYADYTATGRALTFIEDFVRDEVLPLYGNTHTETSMVGRQTTRFREDARHIIKKSVGADKNDVVLFTGSGSTGAIHHLIAAMGFLIPENLKRDVPALADIPAESRPVVILGPFEHHSNDLAWRESIAEVVNLEEDSNGHIDQAQLEQCLVKYADRKIKIGSFSAASNVTGIISDVHAISTILHRHGALSFWDYATAGPYLEINMHPTSPECRDGYLDAVFISVHKFIGGPQTPGVLIAKRDLFVNRSPVVPGGGTVCYTNFMEQQYYQDIERREEGGTPAIIGAIRAGLVFALKQELGADYIQQKEDDYAKRALKRWGNNPNIQILGNTECPRLGIISFLIRHGQRYLHYDFVVAVLNDLYGIQVRGGCSCAGPYGHRLLHIGLPISKKFECEVVGGNEGIKPGWTRATFHFSLSETEFNYILEAVDFVASEGYRLMPMYEFNPTTGDWLCLGTTDRTERRRRYRPGIGLHSVSYGSTNLEYETKRSTVTEDQLARYLLEAREIVAAAEQQIKDIEIVDPELPPTFEALRWFVLPGEIQQELAARKK